MLQVFVISRCFCLSGRLEASTILRTMKRLIALSFGIAFPVETHLTRFTCPRPCLFLPWLRLLTVIFLCYCYLQGDCCTDGFPCVYTPLDCHLFMLLLLTRRLLHRWLSL